MDRFGVRLLFVTFLTVVRFPLVLIFFIGALLYAEKNDPWLFTATFSCLVASALTDLFDGYYARRLKVVTKFGAHLDPLMDKLFSLSTWPLLVYVSTRNGNMHHAVFLLIITVLFLARDQWVSFLRSIGSLYNVSGRATWSGKLRTLINFPLICAIYFFEESPLPLIHAKTLYAFEALALIINLISLYIYSRNYWPSLRRSMSPENK